MQRRSGCSSVQRRSGCIGVQRTVRMLLCFVRTMVKLGILMDNPWV